MPISAAEGSAISTRRKFYDGKEFFIIETEQ